MYKEHDQIVLTSDLTEKGLKAGDVGTIVHLHPVGEAYVVEFMNLHGETMAIATVLSSQARLTTGQDITHARLVRTP